MPLWKLESQHHRFQQRHQKNSSWLWAWAVEHYFRAALSLYCPWLCCTAHINPCLVLAAGQLQAKLVLKCKAMTQIDLLSSALNWEKSNAHTDDPEFELFQIWLSMSTQVQSQLAGRHIYSHLQTPKNPPDHSHSCCEELSFSAHVQIIQSH